MKLALRNLHRTTGRPTVLFIDDQTWAAFLQLASGLRHRGIRVVRVTTAKPSAIDSAFIFNRTIRIESPVELVEVAKLLSNEDIVDVQSTEGLAFEAFEQLGAAAGFPHASRWSGRARVIDKANLPGLLEGSLVKVPDQVITPVADAREIVERLGLPVVVKPRRGVGGDGVRILQTLDEVEDAAQAVGSTRDHLFQQYLDGMSFQVGGTVTGAAEGELVAFETVDRREQFSPARRIRMINDSELLDTVHTLVPHLGVTGLLNVEFIRDEDGILWLHDANPRIWGCFASLRWAGIDVLDAYVDWLRGVPGPLHTPTETESGVIEVFPIAYGPRGGQEMTAHAVTRLIGASARFTTWVGPRYSSSIVVRAPLKALRRLRR